MSVALKFDIKVRKSPLNYSNYEFQLGKKIALIWVGGCEQVRKKSFSFHFVIQVTSAFRNLTITDDVIVIFAKELSFSFLQKGEN